MLFTNTAWYVGPGTKLTDGTDIGFFVAGVIVLVLYPLALRLFPEPRDVFEPAPDVPPAVEPALVDVDLERVG
jgi:hypothetical protein